MLGEGFAWIGGSYKPVKLDQCDGYSDNFDYLTIYLFVFTFFLLHKTKLTLTFHSKHAFFRVFLAYFSYLLGTCLSCILIERRGGKKGITTT